MSRGTAGVAPLQTVVSREVAASRSAVVTVGALHAGTRANVIPDEAELLVTVRTTTPAVRTKVLAAIERVFVLPGTLSGSEDFGTFGEALGVPSVFWHFGGLDPADFTEADLVSLLEDGVPATLPANHSPKFAPAVDPTLEVGVRLLVTAACAWLDGPALAPAGELGGDRA